MPFSTYIEESKDQVGSLGGVLNTRMEQMGKLALW